MLRHLLLTLAVVLAAAPAFAQVCGAYPPVKDFWWGSPAADDLGFTDDSINLFDTDTARIFQGQDTVVDYQYLMPEEFDATAASGGLVGLVDVTEVTISSVSGLPAGINWNLDAAGAAAGNTYFPQTYRYGAVRLCGITFAAPGLYELVVDISATASTPIGPQSAGQPVSLFLEVLPPAGGNPFFSFAPGSGCDTVDVDFEALVGSPNPVINPISYSWDFDDDGVEDATGATVSSSFTTPGANPVNFTNTVDEFFISAASFNASNNSCWCGDVLGELDLPFIGCQGSPDVFMNINAGDGNVTLPEVGDNTNPSWTGLDIPLTTSAISISATEADPIGDPDDDLGSDIVAFSTTPSAGIINFSTGCGSGTLTLSRRTLSSETITDTIEVFTASATPVITNLSGADTVCTGDSIVLQSSASGSYQWFEDSVLIPGATDQELTVFNSGVYSVEVIDAGNICLSQQGFYSVEFQAVTPPVITSFSGGATIDNPDGLDVQWFSNGVPIPGADGDTLNDLSSGGPFTVEVTNAIGCSAVSAPLGICLPGTTTASSTAITLDGGTVEATASDWAVTAGNVIAWAVSTEADGPITSTAELQDAIDAGWIFLGDTDSTISIGCGDLPGNAPDSGSFYLTPFTAEAPVSDSIYWASFEDTTCRASFEICLEITGSDWVIDPLLFILANGDTFDLLGEFGFAGTPITPALWDVASGALGDPACLDLIDIIGYDEDPNGTWTIEMTNTGTGAVNIDVDDFDILVPASGCDSLATDQVTPMSGLSGSVSPGATEAFSFTVPPVPANFPSVSSACEVFGDAVLFTVDCETSIADVLASDDVALYPNPNDGSFTLDFALSGRSDVEISVMDLTGRIIDRRDLGTRSGAVRETIDARDVLRTGLYFVNVRIDDQTIQRKVIVR